jgi:type I restriction enzyme S subunit
MAAWNKGKIGDVCNVIPGYAFKSSDWQDEGIPVVKIKNITADNSVDLTTTDCVPHRLLTPKLGKFVISDGDILVAMTGATAGKVGRVRTINPLLLNQRVAKIAPFAADSKFIWAVVSSKEYQEKFFLLADGAAQPNMSGGQIEGVEIPLPPLQIQVRIAGILSAYDDLIENSQRRINILESMARALYREWFVHFRFPGHESVPRVPSPLGEIPQGWEVKEMQEVAEVIDCLHSKKPSACADGAGVLLQLNNIGEGGKLDMRDLFRINTDDYRHWTSRIELCPGDCVITNVGRVGAVAQIPEGAKAAPGRNMTAIRVRPGKLTPTFLIEYLLSSHMASEVAKKKDLGTIMDSLNVKGIIRLHVPCPPSTAMGHFEAVARPIRKRIELLVEQIDNLRRTRDMMLPRLLSGQIDMETIAA